MSDALATAASPWRPLGSIALEFLLLGICVLGACAAVAADLAWQGRWIREGSVTETCQAALLIASSMALSIDAWRRPMRRGSHALAVGLLLCMFVREMDEWLDRIVHGFWVFPALVVATVAMGMAYRWRQTLPAGLEVAARARATAYLLVGLAVVVCFSRVFGSRQFWLMVLPDETGVNVAGFVKTVTQEGLELLGYALIFFGAGMTAMHRDTGPGDLQAACPDRPSQRPD